MVGVQKLETGLNPLSASSLANGMQAAQADITLPDNLRVVLFKIYERELVSSLGALLTELNARMTTAGILPELGNPRPLESAANPAAAAAAAAAANAGQAQHRHEAQQAGVLYWLGLCQVLMINIVEDSLSRTAVAERLNAMLVLGLCGLGVEPEMATAVAGRAASRSLKGGQGVDP